MAAPKKGNRTFPGIKNPLLSCLYPYLRKKLCYWRAVAVPQLSRAAVGLCADRQRILLPRPLSRSVGLGTEPRSHSPVAPAQGLARGRLAPSRGRVSSHLSAPVCADRVKNGGGKRNRSKPERSTSESTLRWQPECSKSGGAGVQPRSAGAAGLDPASGRETGRGSGACCFHTARRNSAGTTALEEFLQAACTPVSSQNVNTKVTIQNTKGGILYSAESQLL